MREDERSKIGQIFKQIEAKVGIEEIRIVKTGEKRGGNSKVKNERGEKRGEKEERTKRK